MCKSCQKNAKLDKIYSRLKVINFNDFFKKKLFSASVDLAPPETPRLCQRIGAGNGNESGRYDALGPSGADGCSCPMAHHALPNGCEPGPRAIPALHPDPSPSILHPPIAKQTGSIAHMAHSLLEQCKSFQITNFPPENRI